MGYLPMMKLNRALVALAAIAPIAFGSAGAQAAKCSDLNLVGPTLMFIKAKVEKGEVQPAEGLKAGMSELAKLQLTGESAKKVQTETAPVLAKGAGATKADVLGLFATAEVEMKAAQGTCTN